jgi:hypothetical protein
MKSQIILLLVFLSTSIGFSQIGPNDDAVYLDSLNRIGNEKNFKFIRVVKDYTKVKELYDVVFYSRSGKVERQAKTSNKFEMVFEGPCVYYYENGNRKKIETYSGNNINGKLFEWYENGKPKMESEFVFDKKTNKSITKIIHYWNANNEQKVINGEGEFEETDVSETANGIQNSIITSRGFIKDYLKEGTWTGTFIKNRINYTEEYSKGKLISGKSIDSLGVESTYTEIETKSKPKRGFDDFYNFISRNYKGPEVSGLQGKIYVAFVIEKDGTLNDLKILKEIGFGTGDEIIRVLKNYGRWLPGKQRGIPVRVSYTLPITI